MESKTALLDAPIARLLGVSDVFKSRSSTLGFGTLRDIVMSDKHRLFDHPDFDMSWWNELLDYMKRHGMLHLMNQ